MHFKIFNLPPCSSPLLFPFFSSCRFSFPVPAVRCEEENAPRPPPAASPRHLDACVRVAFFESGDAVCETFRGSHQQLADYCLLSLSISLRFFPLLYTEIKKTDARAISADLLLPLLPPPLFLFLPSSPPPSSLHPEVRPRMPHKKHGKVSGVYKRGGKRREGRGRRPQGRYRDGGEGVRISGRRGEWGSRRLMSTFQGSPPPIHPVLLLLAALHKL